MKSYKRTHDCSALNMKNVGKEVMLLGWVSVRRDHGGVVFVDLRDREGITQVVFSPEVSSQVHKLADALRSEFVIWVKGKVNKRPEGTKNPNLSTGDIEIAAEELVILNKSATPYFEIADGIKIGEETRLKYRYLDLRRPQIQKNLMMYLD